MLFIQPAQSVVARAKSAILSRIAGLRLRIAGNKSFFSLRSLLFDPKDILAAVTPSADDLPPYSDEAPSSPMKLRSHADQPLYRLQNPYSERALAGMATDSPLPGRARENFVLNPRILPHEGPNQKDSTTDGKQITKQSKSPPERQSHRRPQSQPSGKSVQQRRRLQLRRAASLTQSQPQRLYA